MATIDKCTGHLVAASQIKTLDKLAMRRVESGQDQVCPVSAICQGYECDPGELAQFQKSTDRLRPIAEMDSDPLFSLNEVRCLFDMARRHIATQQ